MSRNAPGCLVQSLESLFDGRSVAGLSDRQLLDRFTRARDTAGEAAFTAIVARHGPMVLDLCHQLLGDLHHAEDAFQAVFLVLARKARSIRDPDLLANWLYGVALRTARCAKVQLNRRRKKEEAGLVRQHDPGSPALLCSMLEPTIDREQAEALHSEIARLPASFRKPVVLCYFEGLTLDEAANRLRCPAGTVRSRIARARHKLKRGLTRRGVVLPAAALVAALSHSSARASPSPHLCETTARAAIQFAAGQSAAPLAAALALEVMQTMFFHKLKILALALLLVGAVASSAGYLARAQARNDEPQRLAASRQSPAAARPDDPAPKPAPGRMFVVGRVLDPEGKPVPGAIVVASARTKLSPRVARLEGQHQAVIAHAAADGSGRFRLDAPRTSSTRNDEFMAIALAPGFAVGWAEIDPDLDQPAADISLRREQVIKGRLFDLQERPAQGVVVSVSAIRRVLAPEPQGSDLPRAHLDGPSYWFRVNDIPAWPKPVTTDAEGRFELHGIGHRLEAQLSIIDPRFAIQMIDVATDDSPDAKSFAAALQPARIFTGRVTYADTGKPVPEARIQIAAGGAGQRGFRTIPFQANADGRFRANPLPGDVFAIAAIPLVGEPYLAASRRIEWPKGAAEQSVDLALPRGVPIRGKVTEEGSKAPVAGAWVMFVPRSAPGANASGSGQAESQADGSFELAVGPAAGGYLAVQGPSEDFVLRAIGNREFYEGLPGGRPIYSHSFIACAPKSGGSGLEVQVTLRRGQTVSGRIVGPDDQPVPDTWIMGRAALGPGSVAWRVWSGFYHGTAPSGRFELHGIDPDTEIPVYFFQPKRKLGAVAHLSGKSAAGGPITIRLEPCGSAVARLVDAGNKPVAGYRDQLMTSMIVRFGPDPARGDVVGANDLATESGYLSRIDPINYPVPPQSDALGQITFPALIPGANYRIVVRNPPAAPVRKDFTVKPGETTVLGDILIGKPQAR